LLQMSSRQAPSRELVLLVIGLADSARMTCFTVTPAELATTGHIEANRCQTVRTVLPDTRRGETQGGRMPSSGGTGPTPGELHEQVSESRFLAERGERPPSVELRHLNELRTIMAGLCQSARWEFLELHDREAAEGLTQSVDGPEHVMAIDKTMLSRGVDLRLLHTYGGLSCPGEPEYLGRVQAAGAHVRLTVTAPLKLTMVDRRAALLPLEPEKRTFHQGALLVRDPILVHALHTAYAAQWAQSRAHSRSGPDGPPPELQPILDMLLSGFTDTAAARRLNISPRTYTRRVNQLLEALGATTRAQAGAEAHRQGWCNGPPPPP
jgi:hypothetical protein